MKNAIITLATGREFSKTRGLQVFLKSIHENVPSDIEIILFTNDMDETVQQIVQAFEFKTHEVAVDNVRFLLIDRFLMFHEFLCKQDYDQILLADCRDVYFQDDPFKFLTPNDSLILCGEGGKICQNEWNVQDQLLCQDELHPIYRQDLNDQPIINAGFILGKSETVRHLCLMIWLNTLRTSLTNETSFTDQAALNYVYHHLLIHDPTCKILTPQDTPYCATGQGIKQGWFPAEWRNGLLYHPPTGKPYAAYHQWNRVPEHKRAVLAETGLEIAKAGEPIMPEIRPMSFERATITLS
jgi:hypothetical protein